MTSKAKKRKSSGSLSSRGNTAAPKLEEREPEFIAQWRFIGPIH